MDEDIEFTLLNKKDVMVFHPIPPASSSSGHKAEDWKSCIQRCRCRISGKGTDLLVKLLQLEDGTEKLFCQCVVPKGDYEKWVERTVDSSRFFVLKITNGARHEFIGMGFEDRNDAFDFNCTLHDFKSTWVERKAPEESAASDEPAKDLSLKDGEKITINFSFKDLDGKKKKAERPADANGGGFGGFGLMAPPPPGGQSRRTNAAGPAAAVATPPAVAARAAAAQDEDFGEFTGFQGAGPCSRPAQAPEPASVVAPAASALDAQIKGLASGLEGLSFGTPVPGLAPAPRPAVVAPMGGYGAAPAAAPVPAMGAPMGGYGGSPAAPVFQPPPSRPAAVAAPGGGFDPFAGFGGVGFGAPAPAAAPAMSMGGMGFGAPPAAGGFGGQGAPAQAPQKSGGKDPFDDFDIFK